MYRQTSPRVPAVPGRGWRVAASPNPPGSDRLLLLGPVTCMFPRFPCIHPSLRAERAGYRMPLQRSYYKREGDEAQYVRGIRTLAFKLFKVYTSAVQNTYRVGASARAFLK